MGLTANHRLSRDLSNKKRIIAKYDIDKDGKLSKEERAAKKALEKANDKATHDHKKHDKHKGHDKGKSKEANSKGKETSEKAKSKGKGKK